MEIIYKSPEELIPYPSNAKIHNEKNIQKIAGSIKEFGFKFPILITKDNGIICGHGRVEASKLLKLKEVPCICAEDLTDSQVKALRIADNRLTEDSEWDNELLKLELDHLKELDFNIDVCGFEIKEIELLEESKEDFKNKEVDISDIEIDLIECPKCKFKFDPKNV